MNNSGTQDVSQILADALERIAELERKVLVLGDDAPADEGCCTVLCCNDAPSDDLATSEEADYCGVTLEETAGSALRLVTFGIVVVRAQVGAVAFDASVVVDSTEYLERSRHFLTMAANDEVTVPVLNTIDVSTPNPLVAIRVRNLGTPTIRVRYVNVATLVYGVRDGSTACGELAGTL